MTTIHMAPGATVITGFHHQGLDRVTTGATLISKLLRGAIQAMDAWRVSRVAAHNDRVLAELAAHDPRVLSDLRAAADRADQA